MSFCTNDVVALTTAATWMTLSGTALSSSIHVFMRAFIGYLVFAAVDLRLLESLTDDAAANDDEYSRRSLRLSFCGVGLFGLLVAHLVFPGLRRLGSLALSLPSSQQQQQMPGAWSVPSPPSSPPPSPSASPASPALSPSPPPSPAPTNGNDNWEADHRTKMAGLPRDCFISPAALAARGKRGYTCPSYDDDDSAHGPGPSPVTKPAATGETFAFGMGMGPQFNPFLPSTIQSGPAPAEEERDLETEALLEAAFEKDEEEQEEEEQQQQQQQQEQQQQQQQQQQQVEEVVDEYPVPWTYDGLLDLPSEYGIRARFAAAAAADATLLAARGPGAWVDEAEGEVHDVERTRDSASRRPAISGSSSLRPLSSQRCQRQPSRPRRRHLSRFAVAYIPRIVVTPPSPILAAVPTVPVAPASLPLLSLFPLSRSRKGKRSGKWRVRRLFESLGL